MLKTTLLAGCALACVALSGCMSPASITGAASPQVGIDPAVLREANRHLELCHRTYTFAWPPTGMIDCPAQAAPAQALPTAAEIQAMIDSAVAKAVAAVAPAKP
jgi:hypothetical protein